MPGSDCLVPWPVRPQGVIKEFEKLPTKEAGAASISQSFSWQLITREHEASIHWERQDFFQADFLSVMKMSLTSSILYAISQKIGGVGIGEFCPSSVKFQPFKATGIITQNMFLWKLGIVERLNKWEPQGTSSSLWSIKSWLSPMTNGTQYTKYHILVDRLRFVENLCWHL